MKKITPLVLIAALLSIFLMPYQGQALTELEKINRELNELKKKQAQAKNEAASAKTQIIKIHKDKTAAEKAIDVLQEKINQTIDNLKKIDGDIDRVSQELIRAGEELEAAIKRVEDRDSLLKSRIRLMYTSGVVSYLDVLLSSTSFVDFLDRYQVLTSIVSQDKDILEDDVADKQLVTEKRKQINDNLYAVKQLYKNTEKIKQNLLVNEKNKQVLIAGLNSKEKHLEEISEEQEEFLITSAREVSKLLEKKNKILSSYRKGGKFLWPVPSFNRITSNFGSRKDPLTGRMGANHKGVDIGAPNGTTIVAAESGTVIVAQSYGGYGNTVIINHGSGTWTLYGHIRKGGIKVKEGQAVKRGQKIAEVGSTGRSTGNHLHFEVRINEKAVNPMKYLK
ncbi:MAG TPA: peptidoglycan DD-metalloendopeptidase family protein [Bacilli bacterium]